MLQRVNVEFESRVISDGSQTLFRVGDDIDVFESRVISDGSQTAKVAVDHDHVFESRVISDGSQTISSTICLSICLRVV